MYWRLSQNKRKKNVINWLTAFAVSFVVINGVCFFYNREPGASVRQGGATQLIYQPGKIIVNNEEGFGLNYTDKNGYINSYDDLADNFVLIMGNSQTHGSSVRYYQKYTEVLNKKIVETEDDKAGAYLTAKGGDNFAEIASGIMAAKEEFPNSGVIVIQILDGDYSENELDKIYEQRAFNTELKPEVYFKNESCKKKYAHFIKNVIPILSFSISNRLRNIDEAFANSFVSENHNDIGNDEKNLIEDSQNEIKTKKLEEVLVYIKETAERPIIVLNINSVSLSKDANIMVDHSNKEIWDSACKNAGVIYVDMGDDFENLYYSEHKLPFGFANTHPGYGHLNPDGHRVVAERLYEVLLEKGYVK